MHTDRSSKLRRLLFIPPIVVGIGILLFMIEGRQSPQVSEQGEPTRFVRVIEVKSGTFTPVAEGYGIVRPARVWDAVSQVSGRVIEMHPSLRNGGIIKAGTELIRIDPVDYELALAQVRNELIELNVRGENTEASLEIEKRNLQLAEKEFKRRQRLADQGTLSKSSADEAERAMLSSRSLVQNLENTIALLPIQRKLLQNNITQAERDLANTLLVAPFDIRVSGLSVEQYQFVSRGQTLFSGDSIDRVEITAQIAATNLKKLFTGQTAFPTDIETINSNLANITGFKPLVKLDIGDEQMAQWEAEFVRVSDSVDVQTQTIGIVIAVDKPMQKIIPGQRPPLTKDMFVQVSIAGHPQSDRIVIPRSLIRNNQVYLVNEESRLLIRDITRHYDQQQFTVVKQGLAPGDRIVASDLVPAVDGMLLKTEIDTDLQNSISFGD